MLTGICGLIVISLAGATYRFIEYPFLRLKVAPKPVEVSHVEAERYPIEK
jgi:peptidoglycan/LPS O-acetylase OafA/YrhL